MRAASLYIILFLLVAASCKQTYLPPAIAHPPNYLVVEGNIESNGTDTTTFTLSRTVKLDSNALVPETGAAVTVEGTDNSSYPLADSGKGAYRAPLTSLNPNVSYRLHIVTSAGKQYASDYVLLVKNPSIDSITWARVQTNVRDGVQIYANTHDPKNNTHYYRWDYQEVWQFHSKHEEIGRYTPGIGIHSVLDLNNYVCWHYQRSTDIVLTSDAQLGQDIVYNAPIVFIPNGSQQFQVRYSILVKQYALTKDAFAWWQKLQKNTEDLGSIFGVLPSANPGNIHCLTDTAEPVLGYVGGTNTHSQRIFITNDQAQPWQFNWDCDDTKSKNAVEILDLAMGGYLIWQVNRSDGYTYLAYKTCIDCTLTGINVKPSFW